MTFIHSFQDVTPPARYDGLPWVNARVEEAAAEAGPFAQIASLVLPVDADPATPNPVDLTVTTATLERGWYRWRFDDAAGRLSPYTAPVFSPAADSTVGVPPGLSLAALKQRVDKKLATDDTLLTEYLTAAYLQALAPPPNGCGRALASEPAADTAAPVQKSFATGSGRVLLPDARVITQVLVDDVEVTDYTTTAHAGLIVRLDLPARLRPSSYVPVADRTSQTVKVTGRWGFSEIPGDLREAIYVLAARLYYERGAQFADQVALAEGAGVERYYRQLPPRVRIAFSTYTVPGLIGGLQ